MAKAAETFTHSVRNVGKGPRYVHTVNGPVTLQAGEERTLELAEGDRDNAKDHGDFQVSAAKGAPPPRREAKGGKPTKAEKATEKALEGVEDAGGAAARAEAEAAAGGAPQGDVLPTQVRKAGFGKYQAFNAAGEKVGGLIANKEEAIKFAGENRIEVEA